MLENYKKQVNLQLKKLEISYRTWKNAREIAKAYNQEKALKDSVKSYFVDHYRTIILVSFIAVLIMALGIGVWFSATQIKKGVLTTFFNKAKTERNISQANNKSTKVLKPTNQHKTDQSKKKVDINRSATVKESGSTWITKVKLFLSHLNYRTVAIPESLNRGRDLMLNTESHSKNDEIKSNIIRTSIEQEKAVTVLPQPDISTKSIINANYYLLLANKTEHQLYVLHQNADNEWEIVTKYEIAVGGGLSGHKVTAGDRRTPEGLYFILIRKEKYELSSIYGPLAYVLNYPNENDKKEGRTGQGIWIHGTQGDAGPVPTKGCISLANKDIIDLSNYLKDGVNTPILILSDSTMEEAVSVPDYAMIDKERTRIIESQHQLFASIKTCLSDWEYARESRDISE
jgi:L,D-peptidoglycan transpeptidase YkuD (ErfK/YbiS/YcfS/YnhG family)